MTATIKLVGPGLLTLIGLALLIWLVSGFVTIDALRRPRTDYAGVLEGRWFYALPQAVFFVVFIAWQVPWVPANAPWVGDLLIAIPLILAQQMAYLLRVVFPTSKRLEKRLDAECALLEEPDEEQAQETTAEPGAIEPREAEPDAIEPPDAAPDAIKPAVDDSFFDPDNADE
jgi:hypothetical protein